MKKHFFIFMVLTTAIYTLALGVKMYKFSTDHPSIDEDRFPEDEKTYLGGVNDFSRYSITKYLVEDGTPYINKNDTYYVEALNETDLAYNEDKDQYISTKAPLPAFILVPGYILAQKISVNPQFIALLQSMVFGLLSIVIVFLTCNHYVDEKSSYKAIIPYTFGSLIPINAIIFQSHIYAAFFIACAMYAHTKSKYFLLGLFVGLAVFCEPILLVAYLAFFITAQKNNQRYFLILGSILPIVAIASYNIWTFGEPWDFPYQHSVKYSNKPELGIENILRIPAVFIGIVIFSPVFVYAFRSKNRDLLLLLLLVPLIVSAYISSEGKSWGPRHATYLYPILTPYLAKNIEDIENRKEFKFALGWSIFTVILGWIPFTPEINYLLVIPKKIQEIIYLMIF